MAACQNAYQELLVENGISLSKESEKAEQAGKETAKGTIAEIRSAVIDGNTWYYLRLKGEGVVDTVYYAISAADCKDAVILNKGDQVTITYTPSKTERILSAQTVERS